MAKTDLHLLGYASGLAGVDLHCGEAPLFMQASQYLQSLTEHNIQLLWDIQRLAAESNDLPVEQAVRKICLALAEKVQALVAKKELVCVIGGDHTSAIGVWSGVYGAMHKKGDIGLIWIDAHMDSHTPETTESGRIHGMPLACLLGYGYPALTTILSPIPKIKPQNVCLIGVRSFERGEAELLKELNVRVFYMDEVKHRGFKSVMQEAINHVNQHTVGYGLSIDLDSLDPQEAPGVDVPEYDGIHVKDLCHGLAMAAQDTRLLATEIVEFDPSRDKNHLTEKVIVEFLKILTKVNHAYA